MARIKLVFTYHSNQQVTRTWGRLAFSHTSIFFPHELRKLLTKYTSIVCYHYQNALVAQSECVIDCSSHAHPYIPRCVLTSRNIRTNNHLTGWTFNSNPYVEIPSNMYTRENVPTMLFSPCRHTTNETLWTIQRFSKHFYFYWMKIGL